MVAVEGTVFTLGDKDFSLVAGADVASSEFLGDDFQELATYFGSTRSRPHPFREWHFGNVWVRIRYDRPTKIERIAILQPGEIVY